MRTLRLLVPLLVAVGLVAVPAPATPASVEAPQPRYREYVALGDSWTANVVILNGDGPPARQHAPVDCGQSHRNYPKLVANRIGARRFRDASCGSATTAHFTHPQTGLPVGGTNPPQFDRLTRRTDLVTVGIGGNDAGIAAAGIDCFNLLPIENPLPTEELMPDLPVPFIGSNVPPLGGCKKKYTKGGVDRLARNIKRSEPKLVRALKRIHRISPRARILLVDYMSVVPDHACYPLVPASHEDMRYIHRKFVQLNRMLARAAGKGGAELVKTHARSVGHDMCKGARVRYAESLGPSVNDPAVGVPAHPNTAGARAQAASVMDYLRARPK